MKKYSILVYDKKMNPVYKEVEGYDLTNNNVVVVALGIDFTDDFALHAHKSHEKKGEWVVSSHGLSVSYSTEPLKTKREAIRNALDRITEFGVAKAYGRLVTRHNEVQEMIDESKEN